MKAWSSGTHEARQRHSVPEIFVPASLVHSPLLPSLVAPFLTSLAAASRQRRRGGEPPPRPRPSPLGLWAHRIRCAAIEFGESDDKSKGAPPPPSAVHVRSTPRVDASFPSTSATSGTANTAVAATVAAAAAVAAIAIAAATAASAGKARAKVARCARSLPPPPPCRRLDDLSSSTDVMVCRRLPPALALPSMLPCLPTRLSLSLGHRMGGGGPAQRRWRACGAGGRSARLLVDSAVGEVMWQRAWRAGAEASHMRARPCWASAAGGSGSEREPHGESCVGATECPPRVLAWTIERNDRSVLMWYLYRASYS